MSIQIFQDQGVARIEINGELAPNEARELRVAQAATGWTAELAGVQAPISEQIAQQLIAAGARHVKGH